jgi:hypothetical protein
MLSSLPGRHLTPLLLAASLTLLSEFARAQEPSPTTSPTTSPAEPPPPEVPVPDSEPVHKPDPYSLPFQLRPVTAATAVRSDSSFASYQNALAQSGFAVVSELSAGYRIAGTGSGPGTGLVPLVKLAVVNDSPPGTATGGFAFVNPLVGAIYALALGSGLRASGFLCVTLPVGMGGGNTPDKGALDARTVGVVVRADMDNALFAVNDLGVLAGVDLAYVRHGLTAQIEATFGQLERVRGAAQDPDASKTVFTSGVHVGYFLVDALSIGGELRYQRWINAPSAVDQHKPGTSVDMLSMGVGPRLHFELAPGVWIRPGIAYTRGFDHPMTSPANDNIVQLDVPVVF